MAQAVKLTIRIGNKRKTFPTIEAAAKAFKLPYQVLYARLFTMEWSPQKAVSTPIRKKRKAKKIKNLNKKKKK